MVNTGIQYNIYILSFREDRHNVIVLYFMIFPIVLIYMCIHVFQL